MDRLRGKVVIITGAALSIGRCAARMFADEGAKVVAVDINEPKLQSLKQEVDAAGGELIYSVTDVTKRSEVEKSVQLAIDTYGGLDVLYNNVGGPNARDTSFMDLTDEVWEKTVALNINSVLYYCQCAILHLKQGGGGSIIVTTAGAARNGGSWITGYACAKASLVTMSKYIATQHGSDLIRVNMLEPGMIITEVSERNLSDEQKTAFRAHNLLPLDGRPSDIVNAAIYLASDESRFVTGTTITVDGGAMTGVKG